MAYKCLLFSLFISIWTTRIQAQSPVPAVKDDLAQALEKKLTSLTQQTTLLKDQLRQTAQENQRLQTQRAILQKTVLVRNDSIARQQAALVTVQSQVDQALVQKQQMQAILAERASNLKAATGRIAELEYDRKNLIDKHIVRLYNASADYVLQQFMRSLSSKELGFQYDDALVNDEIQITRNFNDQAESWWVFDKTLDTILELKIRIKPHLYDPQKTLVFGEARLLQKTRYSNKSFDEQHDQEKINLYRDKALRMLEGQLSGTSDK